MGVADIFYAELNRFRDRLNSKEEKKNIVTEALKKSLTKFEFLWEDQITGNAYRGEGLKNLLRELSDDFLELAVEVNNIVADDRITTNLREMSKQFRQMSNSPRTFSFIEVITGEMAQALTRIKDVKKILNQ